MKGNFRVKWVKYKRLYGQRANIFLHISYLEKTMAAERRVGMIYVTIELFVYNSLCALGCFIR